MTAALSRLSPQAEVDPGMIRDFANMVFGYLEGVIALRMFPDVRGDAGAPWVETHPADETLAEALASAASRAAKHRRALFVVPATLGQPGKATADNIAETATIMVDLDAGEVEAKRALLRDRLGPPTMVVASGGITDEGARKLHLYWRLTEAARGVDLERVAQLRHELALKAGGDVSFQRITQPIRVPGALHWKSGVPVRVEIIERNDTEYELDDLAERIARLEPRFATAAPTPRVTPRQALSIAELKRMRIRAGGLDGITRFEALSRLIGHWLRQARLGDITINEAWRSALEHNAAMIDPPFEDARLRREFDALHARDLKQAADVAHPQQPDVLALPKTPSEDALAAAFATCHGSAWRHVPAGKLWRRWTGERWAPDETNAATDAVRAICRAAAATAEGVSEARRLGSWKTVESVLNLAAADPRIAVAPDVFDADLMLLNTPGGVVDLATGAIERPDPRLLMTKIAGAAPEGDCPRWLRFLDEITDGDPEMQAYLQRIAGYCLTGETKEEAFFFLHGDGANGKSKFVNTLAAALGDYAKTAPFESFAAAKQSAHPTDLAGFRGARLVTVSETERDRAWAESRIKTITGGDTLSARFMQGNFFDYQPTYKLVVVGNHRPRLISFGEAMRRRLHLIPFEVTIPEERRDRDLQERLRAELGGILLWMIAGCADWREKGLAPPARVLAAAAEYFEEEDLIGEWMAQHCEVGRGHFTDSSSLYASWCAFADAGGFDRGSKRSLAAELSARGFEKARASGGVRGWVGLSLRRRGGAER